MGDELERLTIALGQRLTARGLCVATAESCTGGLVAGAITAIAGSSQWFDRGLSPIRTKQKSKCSGYRRQRSTSSVACPRKPPALWRWARWSAVSPKSQFP